MKDLEFSRLNVLMRCVFTDNKYSPKNLEFSRSKYNRTVSFYPPRCINTTSNFLCVTYRHIASFYPCTTLSTHLEFSRSDILLCCIFADIKSSRRLTII